MKLGDITLNHIRILKTVDQYGSFSDAARHLGYSQALISKKVKQLEKYFDCPLLTRTPGSAKLTNNGKRIIAKAIHIYDDLEGLQQEMAAPINSLGDKIVIGISPFLSAVWFQVFKDRFSMCFPDKEIIHVQANGNSFNSANSESIDLIINNTSAYNEEHPCTRLKTYRFVLASFDGKAKNELQNLTQNQNINFSHLLLLKEVKQELIRSGEIDKKLLEQAIQVDSYENLIELLLQGERATIVPEFCTIDMKKRGSLYCNYLYDINEFGVYIHVPPFSELLIIAEGLVRSFRLDQDDEESSKKGQAPLLHYPSNKSEILKIGIQKNSLGQLIASYGVKYILNSIKASSLSSKKTNNLSIYRNFEIEIYPYSSGEEMNKKMSKAELDICIMDDISLLNNGSSFFDGLNFYSKLIAIASYNLLGIDNSIVVPRKSNISSVEDLRSKKISTLFGSNSHRFITTLLEIYGISISDECSLYNEDPRTASNSLLNGSIDAHVCCKSYGFLLEEHNYSKVLDYDDYCIPKMPSLRGIVCRTQVIRENPELIIAYLHDLIIANQWFLEDQINALQQLSKLTNVNTEQILRFYSMSFGTRIDPTLKPQWSWLLKTLNRRLEGKYGIAKYDVDFWMDDYFIRLVYNALGLDYHFQQVGFSNDLSKSYFMDERFGEYMKILNSSRADQIDLVEPS